MNSSYQFYIRVRSGSQWMGLNMDGKYVSIHFPLILILWSWMLSTPVQMTSLLLPVPRFLYILFIARSVILWICQICNGIVLSNETTNLSDGYPKSPRKQYQFHTCMSSLHECSRKQRSWYMIYVLLRSTFDWYLFTVRLNTLIIAIDIR